MMGKRFLTPRFSLLDVFFIGLAVLSASDGNWLGFIAWIALAVPMGALETFFGDTDAKPGF